MWLKNRRIARINYTFSLIILLALSLLIAFFWIYPEYRKSLSETAYIRKEYIEDQKKAIHAENHNIITYLEFKNAQSHVQIRKEAKNRVYEAYSVASHLYDQYKEKMDRRDIENMVRETLRAMRFNNGQDYYFATDLNGVEQLFADHPELEQQNLLKMKDFQGRYVIRDMIEIARTQGEGFYEYRWTKPNTKGTNHLKIAFIKYFKPFNWFIGTGLYYDDVAKKFKAEAIDRISAIDSSQYGHIIILDYQGNIVFHTNPEFVGRNFHQLFASQPEKMAAYESMLRQGLKPDGGYLTYQWPQPGKEQPIHNLAFVNSFPEWKWIVSNGVALNEMEAGVAEKLAEFRDLVKSRLFFILALFISFALMTLLITYLFSRRIQKSINTFTAFFQKSTDSFARINTDELDFKEFKEIGEFANQMVAAREAGEQSLRESEERFRMLVDNMPVLIVAFGPDRRPTYCNVEFYATTGYSAREFLGRSDALRLLHPDPGEFKAIEETWRTRGNDFKDFETTITRKDGARRTVSWTNIADKVPIRGWTSWVVGVDITGRKIAEAGLIRERDKAQRYLDIARVIFLAINAKGEITLINREGCNILEVEESEILGRNWFDGFLAEDERERIRGLFEKMMAGQTAPSGFVENSVLTRGGKKRLVRWYNSLLHDPEGRPMGTLSSGTDITDIKAAEQQKKDAEAQLRQAQKLETIGLLAGGIAHDFNNILSPIMGYAELLQANLPPDSSAQKYVGEIVNGTRRARDLIQQIMFFSRQSEPDRKPLKIQFIIKEILSLIRSTLPKTIHVVQDICRDCKAVMADPTQVHQVVMNLITNAFHAMEEAGGTLTIKLENVFIDPEAIADEHRPAGDHVRLTVSDTGTGIEPGNMGRIFDPYFTTKDASKGTGLGLSVVHGIVKSLHGDIQVTSEPGMGTTVRIDLPCMPTLIRPADDQPPDTALEGHENILVVDDEEVIVDMQKNILEHLGYRVTGRTSSVEALTLFEDNPRRFDLVITDLTMPGMKGDQLAGRIKAIRPDIPVLLCTGFSDRLASSGTESATIDGVMIKPLKISELSRQIRHLLENRRVLLH